MFFFFEARGDHRDLTVLTPACPRRRCSDLMAGGLETVVRPIGFNHDIALALIPAMAAREVAVSALATANAIDAGDDEDAVAQSLSERLQGRWSIATALAFLAWFVFAPQCISTIQITRRETNGGTWQIFMV